LVSKKKEEKGKEIIRLVHFRPSPFGGLEKGKGKGGKRRDTPKS